MAHTHEEDDSQTAAGPFIPSLQFEDNSQTAAGPFIPSLQFEVVTSFEPCPTNFSSNSKRSEEEGHNDTPKRMRTEARKILEIDILEAERARRSSQVTNRMVTYMQFEACQKLFEGSFFPVFRTYARQVVQHTFFTFSIAILIVLNAVYIGLETEQVSDLTAFALEWYVGELTFSLAFLVELVLRILAVPRLGEFVNDSWNVFDFILVTVSCIDTFFITFISRTTYRFETQGGFVTAFQTMRLMRIARMLRLLRFFREMWLLVAGIIDALRTLLWTWVLLLVIIYVFGIFATRMIGQPHRADSNDLNTFFGTLPRSMFSLFQMTTTEGWASIARTAMRRDAWTACFFVVYLYVTTCAVLNVVVAVIVENTLDQAVNMREKFNAKLARSQKEACAKMYQIFTRLDNDHDGVLTKEEYMQALQNEEITRYLHQIGIDLRVAEELFSILDFDESDSLDPQEFVGGVLKAIGPAKAREVLALHCDLWRSKRRVCSRLNEVRRKTIKQMAAVQQGVQNLRAEVSHLSDALKEAHGWTHQHVPSSEVPPGHVIGKAAHSTVSTLSYSDAESERRFDATPIHVESSSDLPPSSPKGCW